jgi:2-hydroxychromene-2-carboxylate isomerase
MPTRPDTLRIVDAAFYFDLASPLAYLAAERVLQVIPGPLEWQPVLARELPGAESFESLRSKRVAQSAGGRLAETGTDWGDTRSARVPKSASAEGACPPASAGPLFFDDPEVQALRADVQRRADELGLQPMRWPEPFPFDSSLAMHVATYAKGIGRVVPFAQAAFRQAFAAGRSLSDTDTVLIAAAACEMHPQAVLRGAELRSVREQLAGATREAARVGVSDVPAVVTNRSVGRRVLVGERTLEEAGMLMAGGATQ